ncbi:MAG: MBL fold metallo-hydrolase [Actinobacteria bacterium]|nr:MBL fold metallo-hydrolase [Actinomycetota bacterium]
MKVGALEILPVIDGSARVPPTAAFAQAGKGSEEGDWSPHQQFVADDGMLELALGGFLIRTAGHTVLVDAGVGRVNDGTFVGGQLLDALAGYGVTPADVTDVIFTHLHFDHVGWATQQGAVVFENATYRCDERDWAHFVGPDPGATKKLSPLSSRLETWSADGTILPGLDAMIAPGHTPGSTIVVVSSGAERALLLGDVVHCPVELLDDEWAGMGDVDPALARRTRVALARELEGTDTPVAAAHFPGLQFGRVLGATGQRAWVFN